MSFRKTIISILSVLLLLLAAFALAEEASVPPIACSIAPSPEELTTPTDVELSFSLSNTSESDITELRLLNGDGEELYRLDALEGGGTASFQLTYAVTREELDLELIPFQLLFTMEGEDLSLPTIAHIEHIQETADVQFLRHASSVVTNAEGDISIVYEIINNGANDLDALTVIDPLGDFNALIDTLPAGERTTLVNRAHLTKDAVSSPRLAVASSDAYASLSLDDLPIQLATGELTASITAGHSLYSPDTAEVILRLNNTGNQTYRSITVYDDINGGVIADSLIATPECAPIEVTHSYPIRGAATYRWRVTATTLAGDLINLVTDPVDVPTGSRSGLPQLNLAVETDTPHIARSGAIPLTLTIRNSGSGLASRVVISEETDGECLQLTVVPTGDATVRHIEYTVSESRELNFTASYMDPDGLLHEAEAEPLSIDVSAGGAEPLHSDGGLTFIGTATDITNPRMMTFIIAATIALVLVLSIVWFVTARRAHFRKRVQAEARRQLTTGETGKKRARPQSQKKRSSKGTGKQG